MATEKSWESRRSWSCVRVAAKGRRKKFCGCSFCSSRPTRKGSRNKTTARPRFYDMCEVFRRKPGSALLSGLATARCNYCGEYFRIADHSGVSDHNRVYQDLQKDTPLNGGGLPLFFITIL